VSGLSLLAVAVTAAALLLAIGGTNAAAAAPVGPRACAGWMVRPSPSTGSATLNAVAARSASDVWLFGVAAVPGGGYWAVGTAGSKTLTEFHC
jgi:hypothetical protein